MVARLPHLVEHEIAFHEVAAAEAVVEIHAGSRPVRVSVRVSMRVSIRVGRNKTCE